MPHITNDYNSNKSLKVLYCYNCGANIPEINDFCGMCGSEKRSALVMEKLTQELAAQLLAENENHGTNIIDIISLYEENDLNSALNAMKSERYSNRKSQISIDGANLLMAIYEPYILRGSTIKKKSNSAEQIIAIGNKLNELEGWIGMIKAYELFLRRAPKFRQNLAELWSGIGEWSR